MPRGILAWTKNKISYRTAICSDWTGKEATFLSAMTKEWDNVDNGLKQ